MDACSPDDAHEEIHEHVIECFARMGLPPEEDNGTFYPDTRAKKALVQRAWGRRFLSEYFRLRSGFDPAHDAEMRALVNELSVEQMAAIVRFLGYPVMTAEWVGGV